MSEDEKTMTKLQRKVKIAVVITSFAGGGAERVAVNLANYFVDSGFCVDLVVFFAEGPLSKYVKPSVNVVDLAVPAVRLATIRYTVFRMRRYLKTRMPDCVLSMIQGANVAVGLATVALRTRKSFRMMFEETNTLDSLFNAEMTLRTRIWIALLRKIYPLADRVIANSPDTRHDLVRFCISPKSKTTVIANPVMSADSYNRVCSPPSHEWFQDDSKSVILGVGRLHPQKDFLTLIKAFSLVYARKPEARLLILGEGEERECLQQEIDNLSLSRVASLHGYVDNPLPFFRHSRIFVLTSRYEGFGNVIVEAMAAGTSVVSTDCPGGPAMILKEGRLGALVPVGDAQAIAEAIINTLNNPFDRKKLIARSRDFTIERIGEKYVQEMFGTAD